MGSIRITPSKLAGSVSIPASKSISHRAIIAASLAKGESCLANISLSDDITATLKAMSTLGAKINCYNNAFYISGGLTPSEQELVIDCNESASTLRFLIPLALSLTNKVTFTGSTGLAKRPLKPYFNIFFNNDISYTGDSLPLTISGLLKPGIYRLDGSISSQFITGLMYTLPLLSHNSHIIIDGTMESKGYIDLTIDVLRRFSIYIEDMSNNSYNIKGSQNYISCDVTIEGDYSQAAFWIVAGLIGGQIQCLGLNMNSLQGDKVIVDFCKAMNGIVNITDNCVVCFESDTQGMSIDISQCPDLAPILAVLGSLSKGNTTIYNAQRLRFKECDRLSAIVSELHKLGADIHEIGDSIVIKGRNRLEGGVVNSWNDHRIAMALAIASIRCKTPVFIENYEAVSKSYPGFFEDFVKLGGIIDEWCLG